MQTPLTQCWFGPHSCPVPQEQYPLLEQLSVRIGSHVVHAEPPKPQALTERPLQVGPEQHPLTHVWEQPVQAPPLHISPAGQLWHDEPPLPQAPTSLPVWHTFML